MLHDIGIFLTDAPRHLLHWPQPLHLPTGTWVPT